MVGGRLDNILVSAFSCITSQHTNIINRRQYGYNINLKNSLKKREISAFAESCRYVSSLQITSCCKRCGCFWRSTPIVNLHNGTVCFSEAIKQLGSLSETPASSNKSDRLQWHPVSTFSGSTFTVARNTVQTAKKCGKAVQIRRNFQMHTYRKC